jgi:hypothetical protein
MVKRLPPSYVSFRNKCIAEVLVEIERKREQLLKTDKAELLK